MSLSKAAVTPRPSLLSAQCSAVSLPSSFHMPAEFIHLPCYYDTLPISFTCQLHSLPLPLAPCLIHLPRHSCPLPFMPICPIIHIQPPRAPADVQMSIAFHFYLRTFFLSLTIAPT
ncbi:hypothetical protein PM082_000267 [Marasmius tenuissimus]|nr:hypothetical protein PM082_000267 [Marasmius tenuissimus]